ncbi:hypothetical protein CDL15_Pgr017461 [Punica granatum]|uniref:Uncharacterized protein n=1 Tax=Punica granatum TaxID=22663 RepID=A0A218W4G7_PUNGR|nr:hypothetical protein CDL15_Pgr017461 [Punica granatum]
MTAVAGGQGHALFVGTIACDLSWRKDRSSVFGVHGSSRVFHVSIVVVWIHGAFLLVISCNGKRER